jgi:tetratricopeptide (TPR) repeat protein
MIVTFFSWKGGVGRTMAVANVAIELARRGASTLMVDWDLEAPGLHRYFFSPETAQVGGVAIQPAEDPSGLMGLLTGAEANADLDPSQWQRRCASITVPPAQADRGGPAAHPAPLHLLPCGYGSPDYAERLETSSWDAFFRSGRGGPWLEALRQQWSSAYDVVLIDSRTGLTDSGGVCTVQMPDILFLVFTANAQSLTDGLGFVAAVQRARADFAYERSSLTVVPLLSRWEGSQEVDLADRWLDRMTPLLEPLTTGWLPRGIAIRRFLERFRVPHVARFSFGEPLPVLTHSVTDPDLPGLPYSLLAALLRSNLANAGTLTDPDYQPPFDPDTADDRELDAIVASDPATEAAIKDAEGRHGAVALATQRFVGRLAEAAQRCGRIAFAETLWRRALAVNSMLAGDEAQSGAMLFERAITLQRLGKIQEIQGYRDAAIISYRSAMEIASLCAAADPDNSLWQRNLSISHAYIGDLKRAQGDLSGALIDYSLALAITERFAVADPDNKLWQHDRSIAHSKIGDVKQSQGDLDGALAEYYADLAISQHLAASDPHNAPWQRDLSVSRSRIGDLKQSLGDLNGALAEYDAALAIVERLVAADPSNLQWQRDLSVSRERIGDVKRAQGDLEGALIDYRADLAIAERLAAADPGNTEWQRDLAISRARIGELKNAQGDFEGALVEYRAGLAIIERLSEISPTETYFQTALRRLRHQIAALSARKDRDSDASRE